MSDFRRSNSPLVHPLLLVPVFLALGLASCMPSARRHFVLQQTPADSAAAYPYDLSEYQEKYDGEDAVFINHDDVVEHHLVGQDWIAFTSSSLRFMILNTDAEWLTTLTIRIDPGEKLLNAFVTVMPPDGGARAYNLKDFNVEKNSDGSRTYRFAYPDVAVGTVIDEGYEIRYNEGAYLSNRVFDLQPSYPTEKMTVRYVYPKRFNVKVKKIGPGRKLDYERQPLKGTDAFEIVYEGEDIPAFSEEPYSPYPKEFSNYLHVAMTGFGSTTYIPSWNRYAESFQSLFLDKESFWRDRAGSVLEDEILKDGMSDYEKLDAITSWIYDNIELTFEPNDYDYNDVIKKKEGSTYMISGLLRLMLEKADVDASLLLVHSARDGYFDEDFIVPGQLTTPAVYSKIDGKEYVVVPYLKNYPIEFVPEYLQGQEGLAIDEDGYDGFVTVPFGQRSQVTSTENYRLEISEEGVITVTEEKEFDGTAAYSIRRALEDINDDDLQELMEGLVSYEEGEVELEDWEIENQDVWKKPLKIVLSYEIDNLVTVTPEEVIVQTGGLLSPVSSTGTKVDSDDRQNPIRIYNDERLLKNITLVYPSSWRFNTDLKSVDFSNDFGDLKVSYLDKGAETEITMERTLKRVDEPAERWNDLMDIIGSRSRHLNVPALIFAVNQ